MEKQILVSIKDVDEKRIVRAEIGDTVGYVFPKDYVDNIDSQEYPVAHNSGVYILCGKRKKGTGTEAYVGQSDDVAFRVYQHSCKSGKDFWKECIVFTRKNNDIESGHIEWLEAKLYQLLSEKDSCTFNNEKEPKCKHFLPDTEIKATEILDDIELLISVLKPDLLKNTKEFDEYYGKDILTLKFTRRDGETVSAAGHYIGGTFVVHEGSKIASDETKDCPDSIKERRKELVEYNVIKKIDNNMYFIKDRFFDSAGIAASVVLGRSASENDWK